MSDTGYVSALYLESQLKHWWYQPLTPIMTAMHHRFNFKTRLVRAAALGIFQVYSSFTRWRIEVSDLAQIFNLISSPGISFEIMYPGLPRTVAI